MSLEPGRYIITSPALQEGDIISRNNHEDFSLNPKAVITIAKSASPEPVWTVEKVGDDNGYKLFIGGRPTAALDQKLYAILLPEPEPEIWLINYQERHEAYTVEKESNGEGWVVVDPEQGTQVAVRPLIVGRSIPPFYPGNELFTFTKAE